MPKPIQERNLSIKHEYPLNYANGAEMDYLVTTTIVYLIIVSVHVIPLALIAHCLHKRAKIYEERTGKKPWYGGGLTRTIFGA